MSAAGEKIEPADIDKDRIYLSVELQHDVPIDKQQRMATAIQASQHLKMPTRDVLEMLGETDPERKIKEWISEQFDMAYLQGTLQYIQFQAANTIQQQLAAAQLQQQMAQAQDVIAQQQAAAAQSPTPFGAQGVEAAQGQGQMFNPAEGGLPPAMAAPELATRESATGRTATGEEVLR